MDPFLRVSLSKETLLERIDLKLNTLLMSYRYLFLLNSPVFTVMDRKEARVDLVLIQPLLPPYVNHFLRYYAK